jgi:hypothetical protein
MRYSPLETELDMLDGMSTDERLHYATTRMIESEEVWSLGDENGWIIRDEDGRQIIPVWPYRQLAMEHIAGGSESPVPQATSLEYFVYGVLDMCQQDDIWLEVFPHGQKTGKLMRAAVLLEILNGMLETNEYFIEG